jgi:hypothetical protein
MRLAAPVAKNPLLGASADISLRRYWLGVATLAKTRVLIFAAHRNLSDRLVRYHAIPMTSVTVHTI